MDHKIHKPHLRTARDARAVRTREALRDALLRLLDLKSLDEITIRDICDVGDVGYTTFFRHHPTKESLLDDVAAEQIGHLVGLSLAAADAADTRAGSLTLCTYVSKHRKLWSTLLTGGAESAMRSEFLRLSRQIAATRSQPGIWPPADIISVLIAGSTIELLSWWLRQKKALTIEEVAKIHEEIIVTPALKAKHLPPARTSSPEQSRDKTRSPRAKLPTPGSRSS
jgi:AcrR family transcriptional regulator